MFSCLVKSVICSFVPSFDLSSLHVLLQFVEFRWALTAAQFIDCSSQYCPCSQFTAPDVAFMPT